MIGGSEDRRIGDRRHSRHDDLMGDSQMFVQMMGWHTSAVDTS
jgi:hypothetical protein